MVKHRIVIDGIDKTGKDLLVNYITRLSNHKYVIQARGILSQIAYCKIYNRSHTYDLSIYDHDVIFYLTADNEDLAIRFSVTNEPKIDVNFHKRQFEDAANELSVAGIRIEKINTSHMTPYDTAKYILNYMEELENV